MNHFAATGKNQLRRIAHRAMLDRGLLPDFSGAVIAEIKNLQKMSLETDSVPRDLTDLLWCSIDNDDSRDLDQLSVAVPDSGDSIRILVAVADVDARVKRGTAIDGHAQANTTSVYTAAEIFPMLPEQLSTDLTSLNEGQARLAVVVEMRVTSNGAVTESELYRAQVFNRAKLAYNSVAAWLDQKAPAPARLTAVQGMDEQLRIQDRVAQAMKKLRHRQGALSLDVPEAHAVFDGETLIGLQAEEPNRAKELIEELMVAANKTTAEFLKRKGFPFLRRVLRTPERWDRIVALAAELGGTLPVKPDAKALEAFLAQARQGDPKHFAALSLSVVKLLGRGEYSLQASPQEEGEGHFGLAVQNYTHSTAPNRRFPDLVEQRLVKSALEGNPVPYAHQQLGEIAKHCTEQEDNATKVERRVQKSASALLVSSRVGEQFDAVVTGASPKGTWVRVLQPSMEGKLVSGFQGLDVGAKVRVKLVRTDVANGFVDFARVNS